MTNERHKIKRYPYMLAYQEQAGFKDTYGGDYGYVFVEAMQIRPENVDSKRAIVFSHPVGGGAFLPIMSELAKRGHHVLYINTRYRGNDSALIMEKCLLDLGAGIKDAVKRFGYEKFILGGWSGGGSLALFYQEQAERPSISATPAGDPVDIKNAGFIPGVGLFLVAAHVSRSQTLTEWLDASIRDEANPNNRDPDLDLYNAANPNRPPYSAAFVERYRAAQVTRNQRITAWVHAKLTELKNGGREREEFGFVVHGTMADPRWLDPSLDANERKPNWCYLGEPKIANQSPIALARFATLRSWLSQWSLSESRAHGQKNAAQTSVPTLVVGNLADDACTPSHTRRLFEAIPHSQKRMHEVPGARHYYTDQPDKLAICLDHYERWLDDFGLG